MKILIIGFLALFSWSALSIHTYVCKIKGFCNESETNQKSAFIQTVAVASDTSVRLLPLKLTVSTDSLITHFAFDRSGFNSDAATEKYYNESKLYLDKNPRSLLNIIGFTDAVGSDEYNQDLGYRRAQSVQHYFESRSIPAERIVIESRGEKEPADNNNTPEGRAKNRRTLTTIKN